MTVHTLPASVAPYAGRMIDVDTHEQMPAEVWVETFGEDLRPMAELRMSSPAHNVPGYAGDVAELSAETVWSHKGPTAPGAVDMRRRLDVLDVMKIDRQLMFPTSAGLFGMILYSMPDGSNFHKVFGDDTRPMGARMMRCSNDWMVEAAKLSPRVRPVGSIYGDTPQELIALTRSLLDRGIRALTISAGHLPGGVSPAHNDLDPLYAMLAEANAPLTVHLGSELAFFRTLDWGTAKAFEGFKVSEETSLDPWRLSSLHLPAQNFIATLITGGVFDRHPTLRVGALECCAHWIGPLAELLDFWHDNNQSLAPTLFADGSSGRKLPMRPSEYIRRNVRISPFDIEDVGGYIAKHGLEEVYCFATDYPHIEGGKDPIGRFAASLSAHGHGASVFEKFFVTNGELLLPV
jgi:predicted TIM-barrel fold metal-dependent hydrolase